MGGSSWSDAVYRSSVSASLNTHGTSFHYDADVKRGVVDPVVAPKLDPIKMKVDSVTKIKMRESRDSDAHPRSNAIYIALDVTGSMHAVVRTIHEKLPSLMGLLTRKSYVEDPQILFSAVGDATCDRYPVQVGQFESGAEMESDLAHFVLEGGGGGSKHESYEIALFLAARHTVIDCLEKRGRKGYMFLIGDEMPYDKVRATELKRFADIGMQADVSIEEIVVELREKYNVFFILPMDASHGRDKQVLDRWKAVLGHENVLELPKAEAVAELIALQIGLCEGTTDVEAGAEDLRAAGSSTALVHAATAGVSRAHGAGGPITKVPAGTLAPSTDGKTERL